MNGREAEGGQTLYARFAWRCWRARHELLALIDTYDPRGEAGALIDGILVHVRDFSGEARMIGLDRLATLGANLAEALDRRRAPLDPTSIAVIRAWADRLYALGTKFTTSVPDSAAFWELQHLAAELTSELGSGRAPAAGDREPRAILIFDDSPVVREAIAGELEGRGYPVALAASVDAFYRYLEEISPRLVVLDVNMPEVQGDLICRDLRQPGSPNVPVVLLSSLPEAELAARAAEAGADGHLTKDRGLNEIVDYLEKMVQGQPSSAQTVFQRFAARCEERKRQVRLLLEGEGTQPPAPDLSVCIRDFVGESKMLNLERLAGVGDLLLEVLGRWGDALDAERRRRLTAWLDRLCELAGRFVSSTPDSQTSRELLRLRSEVEEELHRCSSRAQTRSSDVLTYGPRRILLVDDSPVIQEAMAVELEEHGYTVALAGDLAELRERLAAFQPQAIFVDVNMPEVQGDRVCQHLRAILGEGVSIILMSSMADAELEPLARRAAADGYLSKQLGLEEMVQRFNWLMRPSLLLF